MNEHFKTCIDRIPLLCEQLLGGALKPLNEKSSFDAIPAIYVFYENNLPVHVGRTRNLKQRLASHTHNNHNAASFAFKRARRAGGFEKASYRSEHSRASLANGELKNHFLAEIEKVKKMDVRFIEVPDPVEQYLLELYLHLEFGMRMDEFDTH